VNADDVLCSKQWTNIAQAQNRAPREAWKFQLFPEVTAEAASFARLDPLELELFGIAARAQQLDVERVRQRVSVRKMPIERGDDLSRVALYPSCLLG
jgi:hypothetical protein